MVHFVEAGDDVFVGQYLFTGSETSSVYLKVDEVDAKAGHIYCTCKNTARLGGVLLTVQVSNKGDDLPTLSEWDRHVIEHWAVPNQIDFISLSFTSNVQAVHECREFVRSVGGGGVSIVAKVERLSALTHIDAIVDARPTESSSPAATSAWTCPRRRCSSPRRWCCTSATAPANPRSSRASSTP